VAVFAGLFGVKTRGKRLISIIFPVNSLLSGFGRKDGFAADCAHHHSFRRNQTTNGKAPQSPRFHRVLRRLREQGSLWRAHFDEYCGISLWADFSQHLSEATASQMMQTKADFS